MDTRILNCVQMNMSGIDIFTFVLPVNDLIEISYVAVRGKDKEDGAVQRVLNPKRIASIKQYVLDGNMFVNSFILNWNDKNYSPSIENGKVISIPIVHAAAQLIDGQHRLEGIKEAAIADHSILDKTVLVSMVLHLGTKEAAKIFININSEQKPVPKSLIYDLYGVTEDDKNFSIIRADDIARLLNDTIDSPYYNAIKYPGNPRGKGKIDLSTIVATLKGYVAFDGKFAENNIRDLDRQAQSIINFFLALRYHWENQEAWSNASQNILYKASGFSAAIDFFFESVFPRCVEGKSFKLEFLISLFDFSSVGILKNDDIKGSDGKTARKTIIDFLKKGLKQTAPQEDEYEF